MKKARREGRRAMNRTWAVLLLALCAMGTVAGEEYDLKRLFREPVALLDPLGKPITTNKALATPYAADFNGDGAIDLIIGAKLNMDTAAGGIWLVRNVGSNEKPFYDWKNARRIAVVDSAAADSTDTEAEFACGCKSSGFVPVQACDWNGDGWMDIVATDTYTRSYVLINRKTSRDKPTFERVNYFAFEKRNHGMHSGGGDWDGDGIRDFLYMPFAGSYYRMFKGDTVKGRGLHFREGDVRSGQAINYTGDKATDCAWAWNFSGKRKPGVVEYVGVSNRESHDVEFFVATGDKSRKVGPVGRFEGTYVKATACDVNGDGRMDVLYSGGVFMKPEYTKIWVAYGLVDNIPQAAGAAKAPRGKTTGNP